MINSRGVFRIIIINYRNKILLIKHNKMNDFLFNSYVKNKILINLTLILFYLYHNQMSGCKIHFKYVSYYKYLIL